VAWDNNQPSWVSIKDFESFTGGKNIAYTVAGLKLANLVGKCVQVDWRSLWHFQTARVTKLNKNGTFKLTYKDGDEDNVDLHKLSSKQTITSGIFGQKHKIYEWCVVDENPWN
jgi:hypothetical protein